MSHFRIRSSVSLAVLAAVLSACGGESAATPVPPFEPDALPSVASDAEPSSEAASEPAPVAEAPFGPVREALRAVFDRESGGIEAVYVVSKGDVSVRIHEELRWAADAGSQRRASSFEGVPATPEAQTVIDRYGELDSEVTYAGAELRATVEGRRDEMLAYARAVTDDGDGWWRGLIPGGGGVASFGVHLTDGAADRMEYVQVGWDTTIRVEWTVTS